jgi:hypothetical protein
MSEHHRTWEYRVSQNLSEASLDQLGSEGWELVSVENGMCYLKRPRLSFREQVTLDQKRRYYALWNASTDDKGAAR